MESECYLYDQVLIGRKETCGKELFESTVNGKKEYNPADEARAIKIVKYSLEYYMGWSPEQIRFNIDENILKMLKLDSLIRQRIRFPVELEPMENLQYLVHRMYPERYGYDRRNAIEIYYDRILSGEIKRFKKGFFTEEYGTYRAGICFQRMLQFTGQFSSIRQIYDVFAGTEGRRLLSKYKLSSAARDLYEFSIDFLHFSLPEKDRDELYYHELRFTLINEKQKRGLRKKGEFIA